MNFLRNPNFGLALQVIVGAEDPADKRQAKDIFEPWQNANANSGRVEMLTPNLKNRGLTVITNSVVYTSIKQFLDTNVKALNIPWQDRRSRLER